MNHQSQQVKAMLAVASLVVGLLWGTNAMVAESAQASWFGWSFLFILVAAALWFWMYREQKGDADKTAKSLKDAEDFQKELDLAAQAQLEAEESADARIARAVENMSVASEDETQETVDSDAVFEAETVPVVDASSGEKGTTHEAAETENTEEPVETAPIEEKAEAARPEPEEIIEEAKESEKVAEKEVAEAESAPADDDEDIEIPVTTPNTQASKDTTTSDEPDDLTQIEGIGPKYKQLLAKGGVTTFAQLADMTTEDIENLIQQQGGRRSASMNTWVDQAKLAAAGDWDGLANLQDDLTGGRRS